MLMRGGLWLPVFVSCRLQSHLLWTQVLCPGMKDESHSSHLEERKKHRIIVHQHQHDQTGGRESFFFFFSVFFFFRVLNSLAPEALGKHGKNPELLCSWGS